MEIIMKEKNLFSYIDNVELSKSMKNSLINGEVPFREAKTSHRKGFAVLAGMAAVLCMAVIGGYIFLINGGLLQAAPEDDAFNNHDIVTEDGTTSPYMREDSVFSNNNPVTGGDITAAGVYEDNSFSTFTTAPVEARIQAAGDFLIPANPHSRRDFVYSGLYSEEYIINIYDSLKYHTDFENYEKRYIQAHVETGNSIYDIEQFTFDFLEYVAMPIILISDSADMTREQIRAKEIDSTIIALSVARAFVEGDTSELEMLFASSTPGLFDFVKDYEFREFIMLGTEFDPDIHEHVHYFSIIHTSDVNLSVFDPLGKWVMRTDGHQIQQFTSAGREVAKANQSWYTTGGHDDLVSFCYYYTTLYLLQPEEYRESYTERADSAATIDARIYWEDEDGVIYLRQPAGDYNPARAELVSIEETNQSAVRWITLNFFGDAGYMFLAETLQFEIVAGQYAWRLDSVEVIYDNPDVNVAFINRVQRS
ncbi:MAG: hypothetical protein FWE74_07490 [Oscillospiraceae bacterium]|nr:hypothetical protein [Oscillospiraceae bacterium]